MGYATTNPYTGKVLKTFPDATDAEVKQAVDEAHAAFMAWRDVTFPERAKIMLSAGSICGMTLEPVAITAEAAPNHELAVMSRRFWMAWC